MLMVPDSASAEWKEKVLYSFQGGNDGFDPIGGIVFDKQGDLYGTTQGGGPPTCTPIGGYCGTVYELSPPVKQGDPGTKTLLYMFKGKKYNDGEAPDGLIIDAAGNLYGVTAYGGTGGCTLAGVPGGCGTVYELSPAGTIVIPGTWVLPNNTTLIGEGDDLYLGTPQSPPTFATTLQACKTSVNSCSFTGSDMIDLGSSPICDPQNNGSVFNNVAVEHLALDGLGQSLNGIVNANAQTGSHVDHVRLYQILGTGLWLEGNASGSGPYSNITFDTGNSGLTATACASINGGILPI